MLCVHPGAAWTSGWNGRLPAMPRMAALNRLARRAPDLRRRIWFGPAGDLVYPHRWALGPAQRAFPQPVEGERIFSRRGVVPGAGEPGPRAHRLRDDVSRLVHASGGRLLVSKNTAHNRRVRMLDAVFPEAKFVVVCRDGRAVARSLLPIDRWPDRRIWWWEGTPRDWVLAGRDPVEMAARHWVEEVTAIEEGLVGLPRHRVLRVTYEAMTRSPVDVLSGVAVFSGLGDDPTWRDELALVRFPHRTRLGPRIATDPRITRIQSGTLRALGYPA
jgi:hypothetical protein